MYSPQLLDHFQNPRNAGEVPDANASAQIENPACGDILKLTMKIEDSRIVDVRFLAKGCVAAIACGSALTSLMRGKHLDEVRRLNREDVVQTVGSLPQASIHASHLAMDALASALANSEFLSKRV
jgi:nitrogen fixation NifU-like protein